MEAQSTIETVVEQFLNWRNSDSDFDLDSLDNRPSIYTQQQDGEFYCLDATNDVADLLDYFVRMSDKTTLILECFGSAIRFDTTTNELPKIGTPIRVHVAIALHGSESASGAQFTGNDPYRMIEAGLGEGGFANEIERRLIEAGRVAQVIDQQLLIDDWLNEHMFDSIGEWAIENGYTYLKAHDSWFNSEGVPADLDEELLELIEAEQKEENSNGNV